MENGIKREVYFIAKIMRLMQLHMTHCFYEHFWKPFTYMNFQRRLCSFFHKLVEALSHSRNTCRTIFVTCRWDTSGQSAHLDGVWFFTQNLSSCLVDCHIEAKEPWHSAWSDTQLKASTKREVLHVGRTKGGRKNGLIFFFFINILVSYTSSEIVHFAFPLHISSHCSQLYDGML